MDFTMDSLIKAGRTFLFLFGELFVVYCNQLRGGTASDICF